MIKLYLDFDIDSEHGVAWRVAASLALREFLGRA